MYPFKHSGAALLLGLSIATSTAGPGVEAAGRKVEGCQLLRAESGILCMAKVSCTEAAAAIAAVRPLFASCAAGQRVSTAEVQTALDRFESPVVFQCCIGNDLVRSLPKEGG